MWRLLRQPNVIDNPCNHLIFDTQIRHTKMWVGRKPLELREREAGPLRPEGATAALGKRIVSGDLRPGSTLPRLEDLAEQFSISRLSMREAMRALAAKGL